MAFVVDRQNETEIVWCSVSEFNRRAPSRLSVYSSPDKAVQERHSHLRNLAHRSLRQRSVQQILCVRRLEFLLFNPWLRNERPNNNIMSGPVSPASVAPELSIEHLGSPKCQTLEVKSMIGPIIDIKNQHGKLISEYTESTTSRVTSGDLCVEAAAVLPSTSIDINSPGSRRDPSHCSREWKTGSMIQHGHFVINLHKSEIRGEKFGVRMFPGSNRPAASRAP